MFYFIDHLHFYSCEWLCIGRSPGALFVLFYNAVRTALRSCDVGKVLIEVRAERVDVGSVVSNAMHLQCGLPQCSVLGPRLNCIFAKPTSGCAGRGPSALFFQGTYNAVKTTLSADGKSARGPMIIYTDFARKRNRKEILTNYNKIRINISHQHDRWME